MAYLFKPSCILLYSLELSSCILLNYLLVSSWTILLSPLELSSCIFLDYPLVSSCILSYLLELSSCIFLDYPLISSYILLYPLVSFCIFLNYLLEVTPFTLNSSYNIFLITTHEYLPDWNISSILKKFNIEVVQHSSSTSKKSWRSF